ncbi:MAG: DNA mismatch repair endonuclease MutL [Chloroflexi bacterium]|nr:DNA mismatch repair endonuclease MutL [Chloroflexota bacterium]
MVIRLLSTDVSSKIAAGEVIERPFSVVKELVENSLDADATEISVEIRGGGVESIRVVDNGSGIPGDQVDMAFRRFATSKVARAEDLESISTLGFRGEALPSIAAVSNVSMITRGADEDAGTRLDIVEGETIRNERQGAPRGTVISVQQLFRNVPARRKFLRSATSEANQIQTLVTRYALARPDVKFTLEVDGQRRFGSPGSGLLREAIACVYGLRDATGMLELAQQLDVQDNVDVRVDGMIGPPSIDRANRSYMSFFVNRRWVQNRTLAVALEQAYRGFLKERRFPLAVVNISVPFDEVDVNAHPSKTEVRFRRQDVVFSTLQRAARDTLIAFSPVPQVRRAYTTGVAPSSGYPTVTPAAFWPTEPFSDKGERQIANGPDAERKAGEVASEMVRAQESPALPKNALPVLRVLGQVRNTYVVAEGPDGMYLIDQHAAHERIVFERVRSELAQKQPQVQKLLEPVTVELDPRRLEILKTEADVIAGLGLDVEPFGGRVCIIRGVPTVLADSDPAAALVDVLDELSSAGEFESWEERAAYSIACHGAIRAGKSLSHQEMMELTRQLEQCLQPHSCPHGRPTIIHLSINHLEQEFGRR